jgi:RNA polymerase sigma factor (sigma-70 family)
MPLTVATTLEQVAAREGELSRSLHAQFRRRLTQDDARDAVADAIATAHMSRAELADLDADRLQAWVRTRAYRNAIDQIRLIDGYGKERRKQAVSVDDYAETLADPNQSEPGDALAALGDEIAGEIADDTAARSVALALERLTPDERRLLRLRHYEGLDVKTIAALLDIHPKKYERLHTRAVAKLRTIFIETTASEHCEPVRALIAQARHGSLAAELSAEVAAHVEACAQCHAYERRSLKLIAALPLPAAGLTDRFWSRLHDLMPFLGSHADNVAASAGVAGAGGAATGTGIVAGIGAKTVAVICGGALTATCVGAVAIPAIDHTIRKPAHKRPSAAGAATVAKAHPQATPKRTVAVTPAVATTRPAAAAPAAPVRRKATGATGSSTPKITGSLSLEDFGTPTPGSTAARSPSSATTRAPARRTAPPSSPFTSEFSP